MRKLLPLILLLTGLSVSSCVDKDYDLSKIDTDDVTIGNEDSEFRIPLATLKVDLTKMAQGGTNIKDIIDETKLWLPSPLPDGAEYVDIPRLGTDTDYLDGLIAQLFIQLRNDNTKLGKLSQKLWDNQSYRNEMLGLLNLPFNPTQDQFKTAFKDLIAAQNTQVMDKTAELAGSYLKTQLAIAPIEFKVDGFDLDESVIDLLSENLDKPGNSLHLYGNITSLLPVSVSFAGAQFQPTTIAFSEITIAAEGKGQISETKVSRDDLQKITKGITIYLPVELTKYYPDKEFDLNRKDQLSIDLKMVKRGALSLNL